MFLLKINKGYIILNFGFIALTCSFVNYFIRGLCQKWHALTEHQKKPICYIKNIYEEFY